MATFNKGDVSEGNLAASITARFISKIKTITTSDVMSVIKNLKTPVKSGKTSTSNTTFLSPNDNIKIQDTVICKVGLASANMDAFLDDTTYKNVDIKSILTAAVGYANSKYVTEWADMMFTNNQENLIEIKSEGLLDQSGTKVDIYIHIDGKQAGVGISLKAGDVKQFGQVGGATSKAMKSFFEPLGVKFSKSHYDRFERLVADKKPAEALSYMYAAAAAQMNKLDENKLKENISKFMKYHAYRNEPDVLLVQLNKGVASAYNFENSTGKLTHTLKVEYSRVATDVITGKRIPQIKIVSSDIKNNILLQLRCKLEGNRISTTGKKVGLTIRNYVEKGHLITALLSEKL